MSLDPFRPLVVVDGIAGSGKTFFIKSLIQNLTSLGIPCVSFLGSGENEFTSDIKQTFMRSLVKDTVLKENHNENIANHFTRIDLMIANLFNTYTSYVIPALAEGKVVLLDRSIYSTIAHQGNSKEAIEYITRNWELRCNIAKCPQMIEPDYAIFLDVAAQTSYDRFNLRTQTDIKDTAIRKLDTVGSVEVAKKVAFTERYKHAFNAFYPGECNIELDMNDFKNVDYSETDKMVHHLLKAFNSQSKQQLN